MWNGRESDVPAWLLSPVTPGEFAAQYHERAPLYVDRGDTSYYRDIFGVGALERLLHGGTLKPADARVIKNGGYVRPESYTRTEVRRNRQTGEAYGVEVLDGRRIAELFAQGCTFAADLDSCDPSLPIARLIDALRGFFRHEVTAMLFLTPPHSKGFDVHYDYMDTIVLQIEGRKRWRLYDPIVELAIKTQRYESKTVPPGDPCMDVELQAGDLLYVPRGTFHEPIAQSDEHSLHVTLMLYAVYWKNVLERAIAQAADRYVLLRKSTACAIERCELETILLEAVSPAHLETVFAQIESEFAKQQHRSPEGHFAQILALSRLSSASIVAMRPDVRYEVIESATATIVAAFGEQMRFAKEAAVIIRALETSPCDVASLELAVSDALAIVKRLVQTGLAVQFSDLPLSAPSHL